jgi:hypothetical protein
MLDAAPPLRLDLVQLERVARALAELHAALGRLSKAYETAAKIIAAP